MIHNILFLTKLQSAVDLGSGQEERDDVIMGYERSCVCTPSYYAICFTHLLYIDSSLIMAILFDWWFPRKLGDDP